MRFLSNINRDLEAHIIQLNDKLSHLETELKESVSSNLSLNEKLSEMHATSKERFYLQQDVENLRKDIEKQKFIHQQGLFYRILY